MKIDDIAKQLANKVNQEHYIKHYLEKVQRGAYNKGLKDAQTEKLILPDVSKSLAKLIQEQDMSAELRTYLMEINLKLSQPMFANGLAMNSNGLIITKLNKYVQN